MSPEMKEALMEYCGTLKEDPVAAEALLEKYTAKFPDFEKWAGAARAMGKMMKVRRENPDIPLDEVRERAKDI